VHSVFLRVPLTPILLCTQSFPLPFSPLPPNLTCLERRKSRCTSTGTLSPFCRIFQRLASCGQALSGFFMRWGHPKMLAHAQGRTLYFCKMCIDPLGVHVPSCKQHTGSNCGHNHLMNVMAPPVVICLCAVLRNPILALPAYSLATPVHSPDRRRLLRV